MHHRPIVRLVLPCIAAAAAAAWLPSGEGADESREPGARYELTIDGATFEVRDDQPFELAIGDRRISGSLVPLPTKELAVGGYAFEYPRWMTFEFDDGFGAEIWTLDGNSTTTMLFRFAVPMGLDDVIGGQIEAFEGFGEVLVREAGIELGESTVDGAELIVVNDAFGALTMELFPCEDAEETRMWLLIQDVRDDVDRATSEYTDLRAMISESFGPVL